MPDLAHSPPLLDRALAIACRHVNASTPERISEGDLAEAVRTGHAKPGFEPHLFAFIDEAGLETIADVIIAGGASYAQMAALADRLLSECHETRRWLDSRRNL